MAALKYRDEHNKVGYLEKPKGSDDYHQVLDFLRGSHLRAPELGPPAILAMIDRTPYTITEETIPYGSTKSGSWDQFRSPPAIALICLSDGRRFLQIILGIETRNTKQYHVLKLSSKFFANMRLNFGGDHMPLLAIMLPPAQVAITDEGTGEAAPDVPQTIPKTIQETRPEPDQSQEHIRTPPRPTTSDQIPPLFEQGNTSDLIIASFTRAHESDPDLFTSTNVEDEPLGGSFHTTPPRSTQVPPKVSTLESELKAHKLLFKDVVGKLVKKVKALELKLNTRSRKVVISESDKEEEAEQDVDPLIKLAKAAAASEAHVDDSPGGPSKNPFACSYDSTSDVPTTEVPSTKFPTGSTTVPTSSSVPAAKIIPASSGTTPETPSSPIRDARKGKGVAIEEPTPTHDKTFKQLEEERLGWEAAQRLQAQELADFEKQRAESLMKDANLARQMVEFTDDDFAARMVALVNTQRKELATQRAQERRERPMTPSQLKQYMRIYLQEEFDKIQRAIAFIRGLKRDDSPMTSASSKKLKTGDDEVNIKAPSHGVPQEEEGATPSQNVSREEVAALSHSQDIPDAQVKVPSQKATIEDVEVPSNIASTAQHTASSLKKVGTKKKRLGRKGVHTSQSTIPIEEGDPEAEHKVCIKYASDADSASDDDTPVNLYAVVDWELLPTGLGSINAFYRLDNSRKYFTSLREILHLVTRADLMTIYGRVMTFYQDKKAAGVGLVLWGDLKVLMDSPEVNDGSDVWKNQHTWSIQSWKLYSFSGVHVLETVSGLVLHMFVDKKYPLSVNLIERMLDHQLEICHGTVGNELTTAVQLIAFLKKQISDSKRPKVHDWYC
ncbi:hypothetical protein Tco_0304166 [Tanacetum coccineum]